MDIFNGYTLSMFLVAIPAALAGIAYILWVLKHECLKKAKDVEIANLIDHKIIKQTIKIADDKAVELEIRVKVLEEK